MIKSSLCFFCVIVGLSAADALAQTPPPAHPTPVKGTAPDSDENASLGANYVVTLSSAGSKAVPELSILVATQTFGSYYATSSDGQLLTFNARLIPQENGAFLLTYQLNTSGDRAVTKAAVLLRPGEIAQIIKNGDQFYNLRLDRYMPTAAPKNTTDPDKPGPGVGFMR